MSSRQIYMFNRDFEFVFFFFFLKTAYAIECKDRKQNGRKTTDDTFRIYLQTNTARGGLARQFVRPKKEENDHISKGLTPDHNPPKMMTV